MGDEAELQIYRKPAFVTLLLSAAVETPLWQRRTDCAGRRSEAEEPVL